MVTIEALRTAYAAAVVAGHTIEDLAKTLNVKVESLQQRLTTIRADLRAAGATESDIKMALPTLKRRTGPRVSARSAALTAMLNEAKQANAAKAEAEAKAAAEKAEADAEAAKAAETFAESQEVPA